MMVAMMMAYRCGTLCLSLNTDHLVKYLTNYYTKTLAANGLRKTRGQFEVGGGIFFFQRKLDAFEKIGLKRA